MSGTQDINASQGAENWQDHKTDYKSLDVLIQPAEFLLARFPATSPFPASMLQKLSTPKSGASEAHFYSLTRTQNELSILVSVGASETYQDSAASLRSLMFEEVGSAQADAKAELPEGYGIDGPWRCLRIRGPMEFHLVGVMLELSRSLAANGVSIFALSTWDTDYVCVKAEKLSTAIDGLREDGWNVVDA